MKKNIWIAILMVITGCCVVGGTFYHVGRFGNAPTSRNEQDMEAFANISVDVDVAELSITEGESFSLRYQYTDGLEPVYEVKNGTLFIKQKQTGYRIWGDPGRVDECSLSLTIPAGTALDSVDIRAAMGDVGIDKIASSKCDIQSNLGNINIKNCSFDKTDLVANLGEISVSDTELGDAQINNDMGNIKATACTFGDLDIVAAMGNAVIDAAQNLDGYRMDLRSDLGSVTVNGRHESGKYYQKGSGTGRLEIETSVGTVRLDYKTAN